MRHVADGDLHAYLDGGLDHYPPDEAGRIREHLDACGSCRDRLEEERRTRGRAAAVLAGADPGAVDVPPFEELRLRARAGDGAGRPGRASGLGRVAWLRIAATAVVALGVGWMGGRMSSYGLPGAAAPVFEAASAPEEGEDQERPGRRAPAEDVAEVRAETASPAGRAEEGTGLPSAVAAEGRGPRPGASSEGDVEADAPARVAAANPGPAGAVQVAERTLRDRAAAQASAPAPTAEAEDRPARVRASMAPLAEAETLRAAVVGVDSIAVSLGPERRALPSELPAVASTTEAERRAAGPGRRGGSLDPSDVSGDVSGLRSDPAARPDLLGEADLPVAIPGLPVVAVEWTEVAPGVEGLRVVQRLATGDTIELRFGGLDSGADEPASLLGEELPDGIRQVVAPYGDGWVVARAPLTREEIRAMIRLLR